MKNFHNTMRYITILALAASLQLSYAAETKIRMLVLTDKANKSSMSELAAKQKAPADGRDKVRQEILKDIEKQRSEMRKNGFVIGTDALMSNKDKYPDELIKHRMLSGDSYDSVSNDFAYAARNLNDSPFRKGRLLGFMPIRSGDNRIHEAVWAFSLRGLGRVIVEELSFGTVPDVSIAVAEPSGNVQINGHPGTYMVMTDEKGKRGVTTIEFMTSDKLFTITAYKPIKRDSKRFARLIELAESLY